MGRPEKPIDPQDGPVARFAYQLRKLRDEAGAPGYRNMARRAGYSAATLSQAAGGERLPTLPVALAYVQACNGDADEWRHRWKQADAETTALPRPPEDDDEPPYRGLQRFEPADADLFFGREETTAQLKAMVRRHRLSVVVGASGCGKSSLLRAGLIPRLRRPDQDAEEKPAAVRVLTPGAQPMDRADLLEPAAGPGDTWVLVDQFEEVFTLCTSPDDRAAFLERLLAAREPGSRLRVVLALRADFFVRCTENHALAAAINDATLLVGPMTTAQLRAAIVRPAGARGLNVERDLTARLLSHALMETWRRRRGHILTLQAYEAAGGLRGAIARTAEDAYHHLTPAQATAARRILLRLITPGEDTTPDTRRPVDRAEFTTTDTITDPDPDPDPDPDAALQRLAAARLVTLDNETVDLAHEALITAWPRLHGWIEGNRERLRRHRRLTDAARNWRDRGRDTGALLRGTELTEAEGAFKTPDQQDELTDLERHFLHQSTRAEQHRSRRAHSLTAALATLLVLALLAAASAYQQRNDAEHQRLRAITAREQAQSRQLATQSETLLQSNPDLASLLAVQAYRTSPTAEAKISLYKAADLPLQHRLTAADSKPEHEAGSVAVAFSSDGRTVATGSVGGTVRLWDPATDGSAAPSPVTRAKLFHWPSVRTGPPREGLTVTPSTITLKAALADIRSQVHIRGGGIGLAGIPIVRSG
ncbi:hypothetical protein [Streptomyces iranensis]|uniref:Transcriptional regulator with XRE-family HTH domain n=1 Tax=Streptomyces iranensis TaxID=576784 RepID=A0A060ZQZ5_9ACTN|nr:hypothetical protein [Streptomyces iranensis]MBP2068845.1 transcriptional regulator with XRE-family HTH domain [Streptomyces iranensis]CDR08612.1 transcriptional regulator, XRE family [Streptomyces iranensis]